MDLGTGAGLDLNAHYNNYNGVKDYQVIHNWDGTTTVHGGQGYTNDAISYTKNGGLHTAQTGAKQIVSPLQQQQQGLLPGWSFVLV